TTLILEPREPTITTGSGSELAIAVAELQFQDDAREPFPAKEDLPAVEESEFLVAELGSVDSCVDRVERLPVDSDGLATVSKNKAPERSPGLNAEMLQLPEQFRIVHRAVIIQARQQATKGFGKQ